jgi:hypothetical protein
MPQGGRADGNLQLLPTSFSQFAQGEIRLALNPAAQSSVILFQAGAAVATNLLGQAGAGLRVLFPKPFHAFAADAKALANLAGALSAFSRGDDPLSQILAQRTHNFPFMGKFYQQISNTSI